MTVVAELLKQRLREHCNNVLCYSISQFVDDFTVVIGNENSSERWFLFSVDIIDHDVFIGTEYQIDLHVNPLWDTILDIRDPTFEEEFLKTFDRLHAKYGPNADAKSDSNGLVL